MYGNGRPLGTRKRIQLLVAIVLIAWATQTLLHQWGYGAEVAPESQPAEKFVPGAARAAGGTLEIRGEATVVGSEVKLKQICRWSDADAQLFSPVADLVIAQVNPRSPFRAITLDEIRSTLHDAGVNLALVKFSGPTSCTVSRSDSEFDEATALRQWAEARGEDAGKEPDKRTGGQGDKEKEDKGTGGPGDKGTGRAGALAPLSPGPPVPLSSPLTASAPSSEPVRTLKSLLLNDLSIRLGLPQDQLQVSFNPKDQTLLNLSEPLFGFNIQPRRVRDLGEVSWEVLIVTGASSQKCVVTAAARAWQQQVVVRSPLAYHQVICAEDVMEKRVLADRLPDDPLLSIPQVIGQQAARELKVGTVMTARLIEALPLVRPGQLVTISLAVGTVRIKTVGRALEPGSYGQSVKVRNDATRDIFEVVMTGPQEGTMGPLPSSATRNRRAEW